MYILYYIFIVGYKSRSLKQLSMSQVDSNPVNNNNNNRRKRPRKFMKQHSTFIPPHHIYNSRNLVRSNSNDIIDNTNLNPKYYLY